jgi:hypothetical protein
MLLTQTAVTLDTTGVSLGHQAVKLNLAAVTLTATGTVYYRTTTVTKAAIHPHYRAIGCLYKTSATTSWHFPIAAVAKAVVAVVQAAFITQNATVLLFATAAICLQLLR